MRPFPMLLPVLLLLLVCPCAMAQEPDAETDGIAEAAPEAVGPWLYMREQVGVSGWKTGLAADFRLQYRVPLDRRGGMVFNNTYFGIGFRAVVSPAFVNIGPRISVSPVDVFELEVTPFYQVTWPGSSSMLPYEATTDSRLDDVRKLRHRNEEEFATTPTQALMGSYVGVETAPTIKLKVSKLIILDTFLINWYKALPSKDWPNGYDYVYEASFDRIIDVDGDVIFENQGVIGGEIMPGGDKPRLIIAALTQYRWTAVSKDRTFRAGVAAIYKPGPKPGWPTFVAQVLPYWIDNDRSVIDGDVKVPFLALAIIWSQSPQISALKAKRMR